LRFSALVPYEEIKEAFRPESLLPIKLSEHKCARPFGNGTANRWFAPNKLKNAALTDTVKGVYIPTGHSMRRCNADWTAESGYHYYVTESLYGLHGKSQTRKSKDRWQPKFRFSESFLR